MSIRNPAAHGPDDSQPTTENDCEVAKSDWQAPTVSRVELSETASGPGSTPDGALSS